MLTILSALRTLSIVYSSYIQSYIHRIFIVYPSTERETWGTAIYLKTGDRCNIFIPLTRSPNEMLCPDSPPSSLLFYPLLTSILLSSVPNVLDVRHSSRSDVMQCFGRGNFEEYHSPLALILGVKKNRGLAWIDQDIFIPLSPFYQIPRLFYFSYT